MNSGSGSLFDFMEGILNDAKYSRVDKVNFLKAVPQNLLRPLLNTLSQMFGQGVMVKHSYLTLT